MSLLHLPKPLVLACALLSAIGLAAASPAPAPSQTALPTPSGAPHWPASQDALPTTAGGIYLGNLDGRIEVLEGLLQRRPDATGSAQLAGLLYHRYRIRGTLPDAERAMALADTAVDALPGNPEIRLLRATMRAGFHLFPDAQADLDAAQALGATPAQLVAPRRELALAIGQYDQLRDDLLASAQVGAPAGATASAPHAGFDTLAHYAFLRHLAGDPAGSRRWYARAQSAYRDSSPLPLAWLLVQQGAALLEAGQPADARVFFAAAHERLPGYTLATEHLAETEALLGHAESARALYRQAIADSQDPAFMAALARLEREAGDPVRADVLLAHAREGWDARLRAHPRAFAGHAIAFFLAEGDAVRALSLARAAVDAGQRDIDSLLRLAEAADAAGDAGLACKAYRDAAATGLAPPRLGELEALGNGCAPVVALSQR